MLFFLLAQKTHKVRVCLVLQLVGVFLMTAGLLVETRRAKLESLNNQLAIPVTLLLLVGLIICINAVCGAVGTVVENLTLLKVVR